MKTETTTILIDCPECDGEGTWYNDTSNQCTKTPWQECCGGCGYDVDCENCDGTDLIEKEDDDEKL